MLIGREQEQKRLLEALNSNEPQFIAVYGRRRVGKTYLVRQTLKSKLLFEHSGLAQSDKSGQLEAWKSSLTDSGMKNAETPSTWIEAFDMLKSLIKSSRRRRKVIFIDELPWLDTPRSGFIAALEHFWNGWASARDDVMLVVCGSATSWIINKLINNYGGLHNRVTGKIHLKPFTLHECELYLKSRHIAMRRYSILECYMILGGIPYYWSFLRQGESLSQNIDRMCFNADGELFSEFNSLYASLFRNPQPYISIVTILASKRVGLTREQIANEAATANNGMLTQVLQDLEYCGFIRKYSQPGLNVRNCVYQLIDPYTIFYFQFIARNIHHDKNYWSNMLESPTYHAWCGLAFERVSMLHVEQIKAALGIAGVASVAYAWSTPATADGRRGAQVDMIIDRNDNVINLCECKFSKQEYSLTHEDESSIANKVERVSELTSKHKSIHVTLITTFGVARNSYSDIFQRVITAEDLFMP